MTVPTGIYTTISGMIIVLLQTGGSFISDTIISTSTDDTSCDMSFIAYQDKGKKLSLLTTLLVA
jgi:hypothetical protein